MAYMELLQSAEHVVQVRKKSSSEIQDVQVILAE